MVIICSCVCKITHKSALRIILSTSLLLLLIKVEKTCIFTQKWLYHLLLMTSHLVAIKTDHHQSCLKIRARDERTGTENVRCWCFIIKKKNQKKIQRVNHPPPLYVRGLKALAFWQNTPSELMSLLLLPIEWNRMGLGAAGKRMISPHHVL